MTQARALLYVQMNPPADAEDQFHAWYDDHLAVRVAMPGFLNAQRYRTVDPDGPRASACQPGGDVRRPAAELDGVHPGHVGKRPELGLGHVPHTPVDLLACPVARRPLRVLRRVAGPRLPVSLDVAHDSFRTIQICSIGQRRAHSVSSAVR